MTDLDVSADSTSDVLKILCLSANANARSSGKTTLQCPSFPPDAPVTFACPAGMHDVHMVPLPLQ